MPEHAWTICSGCLNVFAACLYITAEAWNLVYPVSFLVKPSRNPIRITPCNRLGCLGWASCSHLLVDKFRLVWHGAYRTRMCFHVFLVQRTPFQGRTKQCYISTLLWLLGTHFFHDWPATNGAFRRILPPTRFYSWALYFLPKMKFHEKWTWM